MVPKKILVLVQGKDARGGVNSYFTALKKHFSLNVNYIYRGSRHYPAQGSLLSQVVRLTIDFVKFFFLCLAGGYSLVHLNTTMNKRGIVRDALYILTARMFRKKIFIFFRGLDKTYETLIENKYLDIFRKIFFHTHASAVLSNDFRNTLIRWGYTKPIYLESTTVDMDLVKGIEMTSVLEKRLQMGIFKILFLSRLEFEKGIFICADAFEIIKQKYPKSVLIFGGDGTDEEKLKDYVSEKQLKDVVFLGFLTKERKQEAFTDASIFILPTYKEGLPNAVLEAMAFGLPVITREVGGLPDIIINEENGFITDSFAPEFYATTIERLMVDQELYRKISRNNLEIATSKFLSDVVAKRLENIYIDLLQ